MIQGIPEEEVLNQPIKAIFKCVVQTCNNNHPPRNCDTFKALPVPNRKVLIEKSRRCCRCLGVGHKAVECKRARQCDVDGCESTQLFSILNSFPY